MLQNRRTSRGLKKVVLHKNQLEIYQGDHLKEIRNLCNILSISYRYDNLTIQHNVHQDEEGDQICDRCVIYNVDEFIVNNGVKV